jgi:hypothetical protein
MPDESKPAPSTTSEPLTKGARPPAPDPGFQGGYRPPAPNPGQQPKPTQPKKD